MDSESVFKTSLFLYFEMWFEINNMMFLQCVSHFQLNY